MNKFLLTVISLTVLFICGLSLAQDIYVYPNKKLANQGLIEYRRYTLEEARAHNQGGSFEPYLTASWSNEQRITADSNVYSPKAITLGDSIFCAYSILSPHELFYICSFDAGRTWNQKIFLGDTNEINAHEFPEIVKNGTNLFIGCSIYNYNGHGYNLGYFKSTNNGNTWDTLRTVFPYYRFNSAQFTSLCNNLNTIYMSYAEFDHDSLYVLKSTDWGIHWNGRGINVAFVDGLLQPMDLRADSNILHLVWTNAYLPVSVRYSRSTDVGQTWSPEIDFAQDPYGAQRCYVSVQGQHVVVSWKGYKYSPYMFTGDMFIRQSFDSGATWDSAQVLTDLHYVLMGTNYIKDSLIVITWQDERYGGNNTEVFARYSNDYGLTWSEEVRLSNGDFDSFSPIACATGNKIHVLWGDGRRETPGLYYSNNDLYMGIDESEIPIKSSLFNAYPNPFNSSVMIKYPNNEGGEIGIYNILGQQVKALQISLNSGQIVWDGTDDNRISVPSGVYFARVKSSRIGSGAKLLLLR